MMLGGMAKAALRSSGTGLVLTWGFVESEVEGLEFKD